MPAHSLSDKDLFLAALEKQTAEERSAFLNEACAGDAVRRARVEALLAADAQGSFPDFIAREAEAGSVTDAQAATPHDVTRTHAGAGAANDTTINFLSPPNDPAHLGRLEHFEVISEIGRGGMGIVFKAHDESLDRIIAIKAMAPQYAANASARRRFVREATAVAAVVHEHVVTVHAVAKDAPVPYLVMQFVQGVSLQERMEKTGPLEVKEILRIGMQAAEGLAAAHKQGLVHRDIKPANILLENGVERVKITDFGLARAVDDASVTQSGVIAGTPHYMSPEQAAGEAIDHRSDLFSLGSVMYAMATGNPPFRATGTMAVMKRVIEDAPRPLRESNPEIPTWLDAIVAKLLAKRPADRFQSAKEVAELLGQHLAHIQRPGSVPMPAKIETPSVEPLPTVLKVQATGSGRIVSYFELKQGRIAEPSFLGRVLLFTTTLTDVISELIALAESLDPNYRIVPLEPNGATTASLDLLLTGKDFEITCARRLVRGGFPLNPIAAEFGSNYDVIVTINRATPEVHAKIVGLLQARSTCVPAATREKAVAIPTAALQPTESVRTGGVAGWVVGFAGMATALYWSFQWWNTVLCVVGAVLLFQSGIRRLSRVKHRRPGSMFVILLAAALILVPTGVYLVFNQSIDLYYNNVGQLRFESFNPEIQAFTVARESFGTSMSLGQPFAPNMNARLPPGRYRIRAIGQQNVRPTHWTVSGSSLISGWTAQQPGEECVVEIMRGERISVSPMRRR